MGLAPKRFEIWVQLVENTNIGTKQLRKLQTKSLGIHQASLICNAMQKQIIEMLRKEDNEPRMVTDLEHLQRVGVVQDLNTQTGITEKETGEEI